jgi:hypothetical protein
MNEKDKHEGQPPPPATDRRQDRLKDRLKLALRENLKRRKSQMRARLATMSPSSDDDASPHDAGGKEPG